MAESRDWAAMCIAPVIRRETSSPFQVVPVHKESPGRITASFEESVSDEQLGLGCSLLMPPEVENLVQVV